MRSAKIWMMLLIACSGAALQAQPVEGEPIRLEAGGTMQVDVEGAVTEFTPDATMNTQVAAQVARHMASWRFVSAGPGARPVEGRTGARLALEAIPHDGGYRLKLTQAWFGAPTLAPGAPVPDYPRVLLEARAGARLLLQLGLDERGRVASASVKDAAVLTHIKDEAIRDAWRERFEQASLTAAKRWSFVTGSTQGSVAIYPREVLVLVTFWPRDLKGDTDYRHIGWPMATSPWAIQNKTTLPPGSVLVDPRVLPVDSTLSLQKDVVGTLL